MRNPTIPPRKLGSHHDTVDVFCSDSPVETAYAVARQRLLAVNEWSELNEALHTEFQLCRPDGEPIDRAATTGDIVRIDLRGPGSPSGGGYDWVTITSIEEEASVACPWIALTVSPCPMPGGTSDAAAHFYTTDATNTFVIRRVGHCVYAEVHGRNEAANLEAPPLADRLRNRAVALAGKLGIGKVQWKDWTEGMISVIEAQSHGNPALEEDP